MRKDYVLIDYENVQPEAMAVLDREHFIVMVFVGANQAKLTALKPKNHDRFFQEFDTSLVNRFQSNPMSEKSRTSRRNIHKKAFDTLRFCWSGMNLGVF